jgi:hypothetical protein
VPYFTPLVENLVAAADTLSYEDAGALAGPSNYDYVVTAMTPGGHESPASRRVGKLGLSWWRRMGRGGDALGTLPRQARH